MTSVTQNGPRVLVGPRHPDGRRAVDAERVLVLEALIGLGVLLDAIRGYAKLLTRGADEKPQDATLARRRIEEEAARMSYLVDYVLPEVQAQETAGRGATFRVELPLAAVHWSSVNWRGCD